MIKDLFHDDCHFIKALDKAFERIVNNKGNQSPELLAKYCNLLLKKSFNDTEVDDKLNDSIILFKYMQDKDLYEKFYAKMLAKRFIKQQSQSFDLEETMINKLKRECGYEYTNKLRQMLTDMSISKDMNRKFGDFINKKFLKLKTNFSINILKMGAWPFEQSNNVMPFSIPQELEISMQTFETFYREIFNGRKITWLYYLCQGELKYHHSKKTYLIVMSFFQIVILFMFDNVDSLTYDELQTHTHLNDEQFSKYLQSLLNSKLLIIEERQALKGETIIRLNSKYSNKKTKFGIKIAYSQQHEETKRIHSMVDEDRRFYIQAIIVRIMKSRKILNHTMLIQEVINQSLARFTAQIPMIKKCIELLIDKEYIERTPDTTNEYRYVA